MESTLTIRWMIRRDDREVLMIDDRCFIEPLTQHALIDLLRDRNVLAVVAEERGHVLGYCIYRLGGFVIEILRLGVDPRERRNGVGTALIDRLKSKLLNQRRDTITIDVLGTSVGQQYFLANAGFMAESRPGDVIRFTYDLEVDDA